MTPQSLMSPQNQSQWKLCRHDCFAKDCNIGKYADMYSSLKSLSDQMQTITAENKQLKETVLDLQTRSMRDNLIFSSLPETDNENVENFVKDFIKIQLKISPETLHNITFYRVHHFGKITNKRHHPIVAKFEHFQDNLLVKSK